MAIDAKFNRLVSYRLRYNKKSRKCCKNEIFILKIYSNLENK